MGSFRWIKTLTLLSALFALSFPLWKTPIATNTYFGPKKPKGGLVRIQVLVNDSFDPSGPQVVRAKFNKTNIPLKPRDIYGNRGGASFMLPPGKYKLQWTINQDKFVWPRKVKYEEEVLVSPRDYWIQIQIEGNRVTIR